MLIYISRIFFNKRIEIERLCGTNSLSKKTKVTIKISIQDVTIICTEKSFSWVGIYPTYLARAGGQFFNSVTLVWIQYRCSKMHLFKSARMQHKISLMWGATQEPSPPGWGNKIAVLFFFFLTKAIEPSLLYNFSIAR